MKKRLVALSAAAAIVLVASPTRAQEGYHGDWTDPAPTGQRDGKPLAYLNEPQRLTGEVSHPNGIQSVNVVIVPNPDEPPPPGCDASMDGPVTAEQSGNTATFHVDATFPCNLVYELRATAQANAGGGSGIGGGSSPAPYAMPLFLAVAVPPTPVDYVDALLEVDGDDRSVVLTWPENDEPDLLGYVVSRDGETLGQVDVGDELTFVDDDPPAGTKASYGVTAVRDGPDDEVEQVPAQATAVTVDVPAEDAQAAPGEETTPTTSDPAIAGEARPAENTAARPDSGLLSSVQARGQAPPRLGPPTTLDTGFGETLPFDPAAPDQVAAAPAGDPAVIQVFEEGDTLDEKQQLAFIAGGLAVLVGAAVIFTVTRRAARAAY